MPDIKLPMIVPTHTYQYLEAAWIDLLILSLSIPISTLTEYISTIRSISEISEICSLSTESPAIAPKEVEAIKVISITMEKMGVETELGDLSWYLYGILRSSLEVLKMLC
jgi:hypothetical protein